MRLVGTGVMGVCSAKASVYNSSSDDDGEEESEESAGESKGLVDRCRSAGGVRMMQTPFGWSDRHHSVKLATFQVEGMLTSIIPPSGIFGTWGRD